MSYDQIKTKHIKTNRLLLPVVKSKKIAFEDQNHWGKVLIVCRNESFTLYCHLSLIKNQRNKYENKAQIILSNL